MQNVNTETAQVLSFVTPRNVCLSKDRNWVLIFLPDGQVIRKHKNFFKYVLSGKKSKKTAVQAAVAN
jgi:hypothetical protein